MAMAPERVVPVDIWKFAHFGSYNAMNSLYVLLFAVIHGLGSNDLFLPVTLRQLIDHHSQNRPASPVQNSRCTT